MVVATAVCADLHRQRPKRTGAAQPALDLWVSGGRQCKPKGYAKGKLVNKQSRRCFRAPAVVDLPSPGKLSTPASPPPSPPRGGGRQAPERCRAKAGALLERYHTTDRGTGNATGAGGWGPSALGLPKQTSMPMHDGCAMEARRQIFVVPVATWSEGALPVGQSNINSRP